MINECVIAHGVFDDKIILAKNRDRAYKASVSIVREIIDGVEVAYILDEDTDWSEGLNEHGIGIVNSALLVEADENEKKNIKKSGEKGEDGAKIRKALSLTKLSKVIKSLTSFKGDGNFALMGHTFLGNADRSYSIEVTSETNPKVSVLNKSKIHIRTNHGYAYKDAGYTSGDRFASSHKRWKFSQKILGKVSNPDDVLTGLSTYQAKNMRDNPYRDVELVKNKTEEDILSTTGQVMLNLTDLELTYRVDQDQSKFLGIKDKTPDHYEPKIKIKVQNVKNKTVK